MKMQLVPLCTLFELSQKGCVKPGTRIYLESGVDLLIGDINSAGGVCDDCPHDALWKRVPIDVKTKYKGDGIPLENYTEEPVLVVAYESPEE